MHMWGRNSVFMDELYVYAMERSPSHLVWRGGGTVTPLPTVLNVTRIFVEFEGIKGVAYYPGFRLIFSFHKVSKLAYLMSSGHFSFSPLFQLYKGTAQLSSLTEIKFHFISALLVGETIQPMKEREETGVAAENPWRRASENTTYYSPTIQAPSETQTCTIALAAG